MSFQYKYKNKEASFGPPLEEQVPGGMHLTFEIILKKDGKYIALRRPNGIPNHESPPLAESNPNGFLFFCHDLIIYGEPVEDCVRRIVKSQAGVSVRSFRVVYIDSAVQEKDNSWAVVPHIIAELEQVPSVSEEVTEIVMFNKDSVPNGFAWWETTELKEFLDEYDN